MSAPRNTPHISLCKGRVIAYGTSSRRISSYPPLEGEGRLASQDARRGGVAQRMNNHPTPFAPDDAAHRLMRATLPLQGRVKVRPSIRTDLKKTPSRRAERADLPLSGRGDRTETP
jgi:hypothetical protein